MQGKGSGCVVWDLVCPESFFFVYWKLFWVHVAETLQSLHLVSIFTYDSQHVRLLIKDYDCSRLAVVGDSKSKSLTSAASLINTVV